MYIYKITEIENMKKVTVVIPCYNAEKYIDRCIKALKQQKCQEFEAIFIDDASEDNTVGRIKNMAAGCEYSYKIIENSINSGPAASRNKGIEEASTEYITFCDADDWYEPNFIGEFIGLLEKEKAEIAFCGHTVVDENENKIERPLKEARVLTQKEEILSLDVDSLCMMMVKTSIMKKTPLPDIRNGEDMAVIPMLMLQANKCVVIPNCLYNYFRRGDSASENASIKVVDSIVRSFEYILEKFPDKYGEEKEYIGIRNLLYAGMITLFSVSYNCQKAKELIVFFESEFPLWKDNRYISKMPTYKKLVLKMLEYRFYFGIWVLAKIRAFIAGK